MNLRSQAAEMAQWVELLATKGSEFFLWWEERSDSSNCPVAYTQMPWHVRSPPQNIHNCNLLKNKLRRKECRAKVRQTEEASVQRVCPGQRLQGGKS